MKIKARNRIPKRRTRRALGKSRNRSSTSARTRPTPSPTRQQVQIGVGIRISAMRKVRGWAQDVLARHSGLSPFTLGQIERGHQDFRIRSLVFIAKALNTTVADLLKGIA